VIDAGACFGDTAIEFAHAVGARGCVHAFEVVDAHLQLLRHNLNQNPGLSNVVLHPVALSDRSRSGKIAALGLAPGFSVTDHDFVVPLRRIDDLVDVGDIERVDLIKMDVEGHELPALQGAEQTLRRFRPRLAISMYHRWDDYFRIPLYLDRLGLGYRFYLENYTISDGETILYGVAEPQ
jgi:FkbM family methyltransferase